MKQGSSLLLPVYLKKIFNFPIQIIKPKLIEMPSSFTYIMNHKQTLSIEDFIQKGQQKTQ